MITNLVGQYVIGGWGDDVQYHLIVAVSVDRDKMTLWARNIDGHINSCVADGCVTVRKPPPLLEVQKLAEDATLERGEVFYPLKYEQALKVCKEKVAE